MQQHWEGIYSSKPESSVSWYQQKASVSLDQIIKASNEMGKDFAEVSVLDVGGGASTLVDNLLDKGFSKIFVLDISSSALQISKKRIDSKYPKNRVQWIVRDILKDQISDQCFDIWHDRAVFHFFTNESDRKKYKSQMLQHLGSKSQVIMATFSLPDGPTKCSGLPIVQYDDQSMRKEMGEENFQLVETFKMEHITPSNAVQVFRFCRFKRL